ncbi:lupus la ribonucleoprotein [Striga asiatica]|uniref:Lupus la ribonucleoprotein n=1 Tax=Striga asiatica TaxID=4170 RepID=A0A5A7PNY3_STRAF|nr:lupus la ribonucleoprotein [Striga asiatica]
MMDQEQTSEPLTPSASAGCKKLNAGAPEFVPRGSSSAAAPPPPPPLLQPVYARPPSFVAPLPPPPSCYAYDGYYQQGVAPLYGYNVRPAVPAEFVADVKKGGRAAAKNGLSDAHQKIVNQVEFYFSDINLATTDQLFKLMIKDPEGYVPLTVVASFKKIKSAIADVAQLASILRCSKKLLVSEDNNKVRRKHPLTESNMEELQSRIVVAENLPEDHSHHNLMKIFSTVGSVRSIRACPPQNQNGSTSKIGKGDGLQFGGKFHVFVEYGSVEVAEKAVTELQDEASWRNSLKVRLLLKPVVKSTHTRTKKVGHEGQNSGKKDETAVPEMQGSKDIQSEDLVRQSDAKSNEIQPNDNVKSNGQRKGRNSSNGGKGKGRGHGRGRPHPNLANGGSVLGSSHMEASSDKLMNAGKASSPVPRMPDGTKGFSLGRGKSVTV